ncbi:SDR family NAD(P)-dependent oxidoreductase [Salisediminibacterium selenitireducens]|uniref:Short-chain dehydrogenase/reductase SDR n=1 Tax=Bacillus selenitireducens (strain ATCC 700615 / DSM 15326 / MLS10) TaxID=439292 RepID=D6XVH4_BACIE|nr:SDR family oxidoreductase [Salisediminibacterium selenitireducens]ADH99712.1 short-chain dehydrogenase/reductase SDR [[Bacillus] selenitireducens MLS10]
MKQKHALVTGGAQGIGKELVKAFLEAGYRVTTIDRQAKPEWVKNESAGLTYLQCDLASRTELEGVMAEIDQSEEGTVDVLIHNAGLSSFVPFGELTINTWDEIMNTNVRSGVFLSQHVSKRMPEGGRIMLIASTRAGMSEPGSEAYAASKGAIRSVTHALAASLQDYRITVNSISPGWIHTGDRDGLRAVDHKQHFSKRVGKPADIARMCLFLADEDSQFINGEDIVIDGGMTRKMIYEH